MERDDHAQGDWVTVFQASTDYAADLVRDRLADAGIPAVVLAHRDHAFHLTVGTMAAVAVRVPGSRASEALALLGSAPIPDAELARIALAAAPIPGSPAADPATDDRQGTDAGRTRPHGND